MPDMDQLKTLLIKWADDAATQSEQQQLFELINTSADEELQSSLIEILATAQPHFDEERRQRILAQLLRRMNKDEAPVIPMRRRWIKWVAAAAIILVMGYGLWVTIGRKSQGTGDKEQVAKTHDVPAPNNTRAVITLANGQKVYLDSAGNGVLAQENNVNVVRNEKGEIIYSPDHQITQSPTAYNTLFNPRGSKVISLTLSDGTKVWLNSESSLRYPASFATTTVNREVEITGEAYFEVKHNAKRPFKVHLPNGGIVEDIGTAFNINSYSDEQDIKTTLIEGLARVREISLSGRNDGGGVLLKPGQQAVINQVNPGIKRIEVQTNVDLDEVTSWKSNQFNFSRQNIQSIMRQIARWYDVDVSYEGAVSNETFSGIVSRESNVSQVLKIMESAGVKFRIEGKKIIVIK